MDDAIFINIFFQRSAGAVAVDAVTGLFADNHSSVVVDGADGELVALLVGEDDWLGLMRDGDEKLIAILRDGIRNRAGLGGSASEKNGIGEKRELDGTGAIDAGHAQAVFFVLVGRASSSAHHGAEHVGGLVIDGAAEAVGFRTTGFDASTERGLSFARTLLLSVCGLLGGFGVFEVALLFLNESVVASPIVGQGLHVERVNFGREKFLEDLSVAAKAGIIAGICGDVGGETPSVEVGSRPFLVALLHESIESDAIGAGNAKFVGGKSGGGVAAKLARPGEFLDGFAEFPQSLHLKKRSLLGIGGSYVLHDALDSGEGLQISRVERLRGKRRGPGEQQTRRGEKED